MWCTSTLHVPQWCILSRIKVKKVACTSFQPSEVLPIMIWDHHPHYHQRSGEHQEERTKTSFSLHIHLITTQLSIATNRQTCGEHAPLLSSLNKSYYVMLCITAPRSGPLIDLWWYYWYFGQLLVYQKFWFLGTSIVSRTPWLTWASTYNQDTIWLALKNSLSLLLNSGCAVMTGGKLKVLGRWRQSS